MPPAHRPPVCLGCFVWLSQDSDWLTGDTRADSLFRHEFSLKSEPKRALLLVAGLGYFKATIVSQAAVSQSVSQSEYHVTTRRRGASALTSSM